ncbi:hypothetical protein KBD11_01910, partial [Candidatus Saccharibacteria bacterium]|nr:hypothetical protein [Candidatus Saccharibacteria bacterium]
LHNAMRSQDIASAQQQANLLLLASPLNAAAWNRKGILYAKRSCLFRSTLAFFVANALQGTATTKHNLGLILYERKRFGAAAWYFRRAIRDAAHPMAARHIALAKTYEKLGKEPLALAELRKAATLEPGKHTQKLYINAAATYEAPSPVSKELISALAHSQLPWNFETLENYPYLLREIENMRQVLEDLVYSRPRQRLSPRSKNAHALAATYLHYLSACIDLLETNHSIATVNITRSMYEIYLRLRYGLSSRSNRRFAEQEKKTLKERMNATQRILRNIPKGSDGFNRKIASLQIIRGYIGTLDKRYAHLEPAPSLRQIAVLLDNGTAGKEYRYYERLYETSSATIHADTQSLQKEVALSGTRQLGLFNDSYDLLKISRMLTLEVGNAYVRLPELTQTARKRYVAGMRKMQRKHPRS